MNKKIFFIVVLLGLGFSAVSCKKDKGDDLVSEVSHETPSLRLTNSNFEIEYATPLGITASQTYNSTGKINYLVDGQIIAEVDFGNGESDNIAVVKKGEIEWDLDLSQSEFDSKWTKVIEEPLVLSEECDEIVSGIIKYYNVGDNTWAATIDFGRGHCDGVASKTAADWSGVYEFEIEKWSK